MKKAYCVLAAALLALLAFSCDSFVNTGAQNASDTPEVRYTEDGRPMYKVRIGTNAANRALTDATSKGAIDYYEVAFLDGSSTIHRVAWKFGDAPEIFLPPDTYAGATKAIMFAGKSSDKTLLAVGELTTPVGGIVNFDPNDSAPDTTELKFTLYFIQTNVNKTTANSTFKITTPASPATVNEVTYRDPSNNTITAPRFDISASQNVTAQWGFSFQGGTSTAYDLREGLAIKTAGAISTGVTSLSTFVPLSLEPITVAADTLTPGSGTPNSTFTLTFTSPALPSGVVGGLSKIALNTSVCLLSTVGGGTWYIRGGIDNGTVDGGATSLGGAVVIMIGSEPAGTYPSLPIMK